MTNTTHYPSLLPNLASRTLSVNGLPFHVLESLPSSPAAPLILFLHGFPELSYSWRHILPPLAVAGYHVVAPDQRGYPPTSPSVAYADDLASFAMPQLVADVCGLIHALGHTQAAAIVGHDFGSLVAGFTTLAHPDLTRALVLMSAPFTGASPPPLSFAMLDADLEALDRKHYTTYLSSPSANADMRAPPEGLRAFLRAYFHVKSGDWAGNATRALSSTSASEMATALPHYYIMPLNASMPAAVRPHAPPEGEECAWLPDAELDVYVRQFGHAGFQGGLNWYRALRTPSLLASLTPLSGKKIPQEVRALFISGEKDWGVWQTPGAVDRMHDVCEGMKRGSEGVVLVKGAGHWVQQEQPEEVVRILLGFLGEAEAS